MLTLLFFVSLLLYSIALIFFLLGLFRGDIERTKTQPFVSVVIPVKNEKDHIGRILAEVTHQTYPREKYEIIVVDDESTDVTPNVCRAFSEKYSNVRCLSTQGVSSPLKFKKRPLDLGIRSAKGEIVLLTDADCHISSSWIEMMASYFTPRVGMVVGYSQTTGSVTTLERIQSLDFLLLMGAARGATQLGVPLACTGQNLAYRKQAFEDVGGFSGFANAVGGDDNLLLQQIRHRTDWKIAFALEKFSYVSSRPVPGMGSFLTQRMRWASDALLVPRHDPLFFSIIVAAFLANLLPLILLVASPWFPGLFIPFVKGLAAKFAAEGTLMIKTTRAFDRTDLQRTFPVWFFFQLPYVAVMGISSFLGHRLPWGGRNSE